jgi:hypothetical protein
MCVFYLLDECERETNQQGSKPHFCTILLYFCIKQEG